MIEPGPAGGEFEAMDARVFERLTAIAYDRAGIHLKDGKQTLVSGRIAKRMRALAMTSPQQYLHHLEADESGEELGRFLDVISTNFTFFFREPDHFDLLREAVGGWVGQGQRRLRVWSAASSSGEEPYAIAHTMREAIGQRDIDYKILATDISSRVLEHARAGLYSADRVAAVPEEARRRMFVPVRDDPERFRVRPEIAEHVQFRRLNLSTPPFPMKGPFDFIFCRNVLIYFDNEVRQRLITAVDGLLRPGGWLCIGHTETLTGIHSNLKFVRPSVFRKPEDAAGGRP